MGDSLAWWRRPIAAAALVVVAGAIQGCATIPSGRLGVVLQTNGVAPEPLGEGLHFVGPLAQVDVYDMRVQNHNEDLRAVSADGAALEARASVLTFHPLSDQVVALAREVGPDFYEAVVRPVVRSVVRRVLAGWRVDELDTPGILRVQSKVAEVVSAELQPFHIRLDSVNMRTLALLPSSAAYGAIVSTGVEEQEVLLARQRVELARRHADNTREAARGVAAAHADVAPTLNPGVLEDEAARAWTALITSPSSTVDVHPRNFPQLTEVSP